jgi:hypothetical protein
MQKLNSQNYARTESEKQGKDSSKFNTSTPNSALLECSSLAMKEAILDNVHFFEGKAIRVRPYMDEAELIDHIETIRETRMFVNGIPSWFTNESLASFFTQFGEVKSAYITKEPTKNDQRLGYVIFKEKGVIELFNPSGIKIDAKHTLGWNSYYHKNDKKSSFGKNKIQEKTNPSRFQNFSPSNPMGSSNNLNNVQIKPKPQLYQHQMQLMILEQQNQQILSPNKTSPPGAKNKLTTNKPISNNSGNNLSSSFNKLDHSVKPFQRNYFSAESQGFDKNHVAWNLIFNLIIPKPETIF